MADGLSLVLWSLAEYFNYFSVTLIILCSGLMTAFIIRLNGDHWGRYHNGASQGESSLAFQRDVTSFSNPFFLKLSSATVSSLANGVWVELSCLEPCEVHVYWGAVISPMHAAMLKMGTDFLEDMRTEALWSKDCLATERHRLHTKGKHSLHLRVPKEMDADKLGPPPRQRYPCVVVMATIDSSSTAEHTNVVAVVSVLHLKDGQCAMETHLIAQYAKMAGLAVYNLQPLFFASELDEDGDAANSQLNDSSTNSQPAEDNSEMYGTQAADMAQHLSGQRAHTPGRDGDRWRSDVLNSPSGDCAQEISDDHSQEQAATVDCGNREFDNNGAAFQRQDSAWESTLPECIVCQSRPLNCALLPCRHTCVCRVCFHKLDRCPMCRSYIESYFTLCDDDDYGDIGISSSQEEPVPLDLHSRFERFNQRLNNLLGFE
ncbi:cell growth regulator with RING finger domain protein 1-like [Babylonia areolata]|uniref:cell growth regulator with RING finger domain protein 1-like n=1 Tax=Babylonia areolata TaxID=304850 RepID=UPI003FCF6928